MIRRTGPMIRVVFGLAVRRDGLKRYQRFSAHGDSPNSPRVQLEVIARANHVVHTTVSPFLAVAQLDAVRFL